MNQSEIMSAYIKDTYREFSLSNSPSSPILTTAFRVSDSDFKQQLLSKNTGDLVDVEGPYGVFTPLENINNSTFYIAGPPSMVANVRQILLRLGILDSRIVTEEFSGYA